jgi:hypothetical protein
MIFFIKAHKISGRYAFFRKVSSKIMIQQLPGFILIAIVAAFIFMVNSINLKKNRAIHLRAVMLHLENRSRSGEEVSEEELFKAVSEYNSAAEEFNISITSGAGSVLNMMLRYPLFELQETER